MTWELFHMADRLIRGTGGWLTTAAAIEHHAALRLFDWHQGVLDDGVAHEPRLLEGPAAYARCCAIYRAAGWPVDP